MNTIFWLGRFERRKFPAELAERLCAICPPDTDDPSLLQWHLEERNPRLRRLQDCLRHAGYTPWHGPQRQQPLEYICYAQRNFFPTDLRQAEYLEPSPYRAVNAKAKRDKSGRLIVQSEYWQYSSFPIGAAGKETIAVTTALREKMEKAGLQHLVFKETVVKGPDAKQHQGNWWELTSDLVLPPLALDCRKTWAELGFKGGTGYVLCEPPYRPAQLHYRWADLAKVEPFDVALIREELYDAHHRDASLKRLVVSQRFYRFCAARHLRLSGIPVKVDGPCTEMEIGSV